MPPHPLSREEMETVIRCSAADQEWDIVTADARFIRYLKRRGWTGRTDRQFGDPYVGFVVPFKAVRLLSAQKRKAPTGAFKKQNEPTGRDSGRVSPTDFPEAHTEVSPSPCRSV